MMYVSNTKSRDKIFPFWCIAGLMGASTSIWDFRSNTLKMIKYKYRLSSNIVLCITSTFDMSFDMYLDTITKNKVHFRNYRYVINICTTK